MNLHLTQHSIERLAQRGFQSTDAELIMAIGSEVEDGYFVSAKDCQAIEREVKRFLERLRRLGGKRLVVSDGCLITGYRATKREEKRLLRARRG